jgi:outer membrane protein TolC
VNSIGGWERLATAATLVAAAVVVLTLQGCVGPDRRYDLEELYDGPPKPETTPLLDPALLPAPEVEDPAPLPSAEQGAISLSIEQAILLALRRNQELQVERFTPVVAGSFEQLERGVFDPELFASLTASEETAIETSRSTQERFNVESRNDDAEIGVRQLFPMGTTVGASLAYDRSLSNRTPEQQSVRAGLTVTQALLEGFGPAVNLVDVRQAELGARASLFELRGFIEALVANTEIAYWRYVLAREQISIFEQSLDVARRQLNEVEQRIEVGTMPRNAAAAARAEVARREQALLEVRSISEDRRLRLLRLLNASSDEQFRLAIDPISPPQTAVVPLTDLGERLELADSMRPDLNEARLRLEQSSLEVVQTRNGLLPRLDLFITLGTTGYAESFGDAFNNLDGDTYDLTAGLRFSAFLGNRQARALDLAARASRDQADAAVGNLRNLAQLDVRLALNEVDRARQQIEAGAVTVALQKQTLEAEQERFSVGASTSLLVAQAQRDLLVSQLTQVDAIVNYRVALVSLYLSEGTLLQRRGIALDDTDSLNSPR